MYYGMAAVMFSMTIMVYVHIALVGGSYGAYNTGQQDNLARV